MAVVLAWASESVTGRTHGWFTLPVGPPKSDGFTMQTMTGVYLSGPFARLGDDHQRAAIGRLLELGEDVELPDPKDTVPVIARLAQQHPRPNLLNLEAVAAAIALNAMVVLSPKAALGVLPGVLKDQGISWRQSGLA